MSSPVADVFRWGQNPSTGQSGLELLDHCDLTDTTIIAADSWLVTEGATRALDLHRQRFMTSIPRGYSSISDPGAFWDAAIAAIPRTGEWFPRVEMHAGPRYLLRLRSAPARRKEIVLATAKSDPRTTPNVKGPDLEALTQVRVEAQQAGADEGVILSPDGYVIEASQSELAWWRGSILCTVPPEFTRVDSVTRRSLLALATALGVETHTEAATPAELDGTELWALNAVHGARIVTRWVGGPATAELPGRLTLWRTRLDALRHTLPHALPQVEPSA